MSFCHNRSYFEDFEAQALRLSVTPRRLIGISGRHEVEGLLLLPSRAPSMHLVATVPPRVDKFPPPAGKLPKSRRRRQFFAENWRFLPKIGNFSPNAANISIFRLLGDLARQYQVFWAKMPPMNLDQKGH